MIGIILNGGASRRMGTSKAQLEWDGTPLLTHMQTVLKQTNVEAVHLCQQTGDDALCDAYPGLGPLAGIESALRHTPTGAYLLIVPVDMPLLTPALLTDLTAPLNTHTAAYYPNGPLPLGLKNTPQAHTQAKTMLKEAQTQNTVPKLRHFMAALDAYMLPMPPDGHRLLQNLNTPEDWKKAHETNPE